MFYSIIVPVFNRPEEVDELLNSLSLQTYKQFEVLIIEDGSKRRCDNIVEKYTDQLDIKYYLKKNSGPGSTRNYGAERSNGEYLIIIDSDCILPRSYLSVIDEFLKKNPIDAFGGPDCAHSSFTRIQKAINYSMTSFFTTGGIRGGKKQMDKFYPRSFNMGIKKSVYLTLGGFSSIRFGEDIDFSIRIYKNGYTCQYIPEAWVYHKRRTNLKRFFKQVHNSGIARINLYKRYPESLKLVHTLPAIFTIFCTLFLLGSLFYPWAITPLLLYSLLVFIDSSIKNRSLQIGVYSIAAAFIQLIGYGTGFLQAWWLRCVCKKKEYAAFEDSFYK